MRRKAQLIALAVVAVLVACTARLSAQTETIQIHDDVIFVDDGSDEPNTAPAGDVNVPCPRVADAMRPALVFVEADAAGERLCIAWFPSTGVQKVEVASAKSIQVTQLDRATFLVGTSGGSTDRGVFVLDLNRGVGRQLAQSTRIGCLRSVPERGKAMLSHTHLGAGEVRYLELDLTTLTLALRRTFTKDDLGDKFPAVCLGTALSLDFQHVAYMDGPLTPVGEYCLAVMDLSTLQTGYLDQHVGLYRHN